MKRLIAFILLLSLFSYPIKGFAKIDIPLKIGDIYVQDNANLITSDDKKLMLSLGNELEDKTSAQLAVLTVNSLEGNDIKEYSNQAFRTYGIGNKKKNNGVLIVLAKNERKIRIEVGYGLEGTVTDIRSGEILEKSAFPYLKKGEYSTGITSTYKSLYSLILNDGKDTNDTKVGHKEKSSFSIIQLIGILSIIIIFFVIDFRFFGGFFTKLLYMIFLLFSNNGNSGRGGGSGGGGRSGGGGSSGGGGADRSF